jgi:superfamily II RNA helicase
VGTELVFDGVLNELNAAQCVAFLSAMLDSERSSDRTPAESVLPKAIVKLQNAARMICNVQNECANAIGSCRMLAAQARWRRTKRSTCRSSSLR